MPHMTADEASRLARGTGLAYILIAALALPANFLGTTGVYVSGDPAATFAAIRDAEQTFRLAIGAFTAMLVLDAVVAWGLYLLLRPAGGALALFAFVTHLIYTAMHGAGLVNLLGVLPLLDETTSEAVREVTSLTRAHGGSFLLSLVFFGVHLVAAGVLVRRAAWMPGLFGVLLMASGAAYIVDTAAAVLLTEPDAVRGITELAVIVIALIGEIGFAFWLLLRGIPRERWPAPAAP